MSVTVSTSSLLEKIEAQSVSLNHVVINISGEGIPRPIVYSWDSCSDCPTPNPVPPAFVVEVPSGERRFVQVLAVYQDSTNDSMALKYGDLNLDVLSSDVIAPVSVFDVGGGNIMEGRVTGRYVTTQIGGVQFGPSGPVDIKFKPTDKPPIIIDRDHIYAGWFSFFMLRGVNLVYEMQDGTLLWDEPVDLAHTKMGLPYNLQGAFFKSWVPQHRVQQNDQNGLTWRTRGPHIKVFGYFGLQSFLSANRVCRDGISDNTSSLFVGDSYTQRLGVLNAAPAAGVDFFSNHNDSYYIGGETSLGAVCGTLGTANLYSQYLKITQGHIDSRDDQTAPFFGPFRQLAATGGALEILAPAGLQSRQIKGHFLPGAQVGVDSVRIYKAVGASAQNYNFRKVPCGAIAAGVPPFNEFIFAGVGSVGNDGTFTVNAGVSNQDILGGVSAAICPAFGNIVWPMGAMLSSEAFGRCRGCQAVQADRIDLRLGVSSLTTSKCVPLEAQLYSSQNQAFLNTQTVSIGVTGIRPGAGFYSNRTCTTSLANLQILPNETRKSFYYMDDGTSGNAVGTLGFVAASASVTGTIAVAYNFNTSAGGTTEIHFGRKRTALYSPGQCEDVELWALNQGRTWNWSGVTTVQFKSTPAGAVTVHPNCEKALTSGGSSSITGISPTSYFAPLALRTETTQFDVGVQVQAMSSGAVLSRFGLVVKSPLQFDPSMWFRVETSGGSVAAGLIQQLYSRVGTQMLSGCAGADCPAMATQTTGSGSISYANFSDPSDYLYRSGLADLGSRSSTTFALVRLTAASTGNIIFQFENSLGAPFGTLGVFWDSGAGNISIVETDATPSTSMTSHNVGVISGINVVWKVVALTRLRGAGGASTLNLYVDGALVGTTLSPAASRDWDYMFVGGYPGGTSALGGGIAEVIHVDRVLSSQEILSTYNFMKGKYPFLGLP